MEFGQNQPSAGAGGAFQALYSIVEEENHALNASDLRFSAGDNELRPTGEFPVRRRVFFLAKWALPMMICGFSNLAMGTMLHIGTYYYVRVMDRFERVYSEPSLNISMREKGTDLSPGLWNDTFSFGSLQDPIEAELGWSKVSLHELDLAAAVLPAFWFVGTIYDKDLQGWSKTLLCHSMLALVKGLFSCITIVPDSIGWKSCKSRLGEVNLEHIRAVPDPEDSSIWAMLSSILSLEMTGFASRKPVRFCADMLYSGHTFVTCLYGFALIELARKLLLKWEWHGPKYRNTRQAIIYSLTSFFVIEQVIEIRLVLKNRFHYTVDIVMAIIMTLLWFTNGPVAVAAQRWATFGEGVTGPGLPEAEKEKERKKLLAELKVIDDKLELENKELKDYVLVETAMPTCKDFSNHLEGKNFVLLKKGVPVDKPTQESWFFGEPERSAILKAVGNKSAEIPAGLAELAAAHNLRLLPKEAVQRRDGDMWVPPACVPFACCCLSGKFFLVSERHMDRYLDPNAIDLDLENGSSALKANTT
ncbi:unnamed protein product [Polarella glacialis]|uniref:Sphingomyelin synthase-like domain-containing protein n=1 Tax=Polarella glacialis TaxID=89957 RepID=A0A813HPB9_POLGL|nr:unnamed protein product [Polarella glacialis]